MRGTDHALLDTQNGHSVGYLLHKKVTPGNTRRILEKIGGLPPMRLELGFGKP